MKKNSFGVYLALAFLILLTFQEETQAYWKTLEKSSESSVQVETSTVIDKKYDLSKQPEWIDSENTNGNPIFIDKESIYKTENGYVYAVKYMSKNNEQVVSHIYSEFKNYEAGIIETTTSDKYTRKYNFENLDEVNMKKLTKDSPLYNSYDLVSKYVQNQKNKIPESTPDFEPYMKELQALIKRNWMPPKGDTSKRVVVLFKIAKDGRLLSAKIDKSSGSTTADQAALTAIKLSAPFRPLPSKYAGKEIDIQFSFDYNVIRGEN